MIAVYKRELRSYLTSMIGYLFLQNGGALRGKNRSRVW